MNWVDKLGNFWPIVPYLVVPVLVARFLVRGRWIEIVQAYGIWLALMVAFGLLHHLGTGKFGEGLGWAFIMALFFTTLAIPVIVLLLKLRAYFRPGSTR